MEAQPNIKSKRLVTISLVLGTIAFVLVILPFLWEPEIFSSNPNPMAEYRFIYKGILFWTWSLALEIPGCITALFAFSRDEPKSGDKKLKNIATISFALNTFLLVSALCLYLFTPRMSFPQFSTISSSLLP